MIDGAPVIVKRVPVPVGASDLLDREPADLVAHRSYSLRVIGAALVAAGHGAGSAVVAAQLGIPAGTVRSWLRRACGNVEQLYRFGMQTVVALDPELLATTPRPIALGDALDALAAAALATIQRFTPNRPPRLWPVINVLTPRPAACTRLPAVTTRHLPCPTTLTPASSTTPIRLAP